MTIRAPARMPFLPPPIASRKTTPAFFTQAARGLELNGQPTLKPDSFDKSEVDASYARCLVEYARKWFGDYKPGHAIDSSQTGKVKIGDLALGRAIYDVLTSKIVTSPTGLASAQDRDRESVRRELAFRTNFDRKMISYLRKTYGAHHLAGAHVIYNGHATGATMSLFPILQALGLASGGYRRAAYSGDKGAALLLNTILTALMGTADRDFNLAGKPEQVIAELLTPGIVMVVNGGPMLLPIDLPVNVLARIRKGDIRFVLHNAADLAAFNKLKDKYPDTFAKAISIDLAHSEPKALELSVIGEQIAYHGDNASQVHNGTPIQKSLAMVVGFGMMGQAITESLLGQGCHRDNIIIVDPNASTEALALAQKRGLTIYPTVPETIYAGTEKLRDQEDAVCFVATNNDGGLDAGDLPFLPQHVVVVGANSGGIGVDVEGMYAAYGHQTAFDHYCGSHGVSKDETADFADIVAISRPESAAHQPEQLAFVNIRTQEDGTGDAKKRRMRVFAPNLTDTLGQERLPTSAMIACAVCKLMSTHRPGADGEPHPFDPEDAQAVHISAFPRFNDDAAM